MPIAVEFDFKGMTLDQYDQAIEMTGFKPGGPHAPGCLFHWTAETADGFRVVDVWETREQFDRFKEEQILPWAQQVGMTQEPAETYTEIHNYLTAG